jgi:hypothetical protein
MLKTLVFVSLGVIACLIITSKMSSKSHAELDRNVAHVVDQATVAGLDATQKGLNKANQELGEARKNAAK